MSLPVPVLDDRTYDQLVAELVGRIAAYAPEWTDQGASDPGVTLLELFAFLGETLLFRFNQIPDATQLWLLRQLQEPPIPAQPAAGLVTCAPQDTTKATFVDVHQGDIVRAGNLGFEAAQDLTSLPVTARAVIKRTAALPTDVELLSGVERSIDALGGLATGEQPACYTAETLRPALGAPGVFPLSVPDAVDQTLWIAIIAAGSADPAQLLGPAGKLGGQVLNVGVSLADRFPTMDQVDRCHGLDPIAPAGSAVPPPQTNWQVSTVEVDGSGAPVYLPLEVVADTTAALTTDGVVRLRLPSGLSVGATEIGTVADSDPDVAGTGNRPPPLDDHPATLLWLRAYPAPGAPPIGALQWVGVNAVMVDQAETVGPEFVGTGTGMPRQQYRLVNQSVDAASLVLQVEEHGVWVTWQRVDSFAASSRDDRHFVLDPAGGVVACGDTLRGRAFQIGERIRALSYRHGGGVAGNVAPMAISKIDGSAPLVIQNPLALTGGADAETIADALTRIPGEFARHDRAVTASDFRELAAIVGVGRAECLPHFYPPTRDLDAAGVVTVMVWPTQDLLHPDAPTPDVSMLGEVCARLDARRLITTELYVVPPTYHQVAVAVGVVVKAGFSGTAVCRWVEQVIRQFLAPLPPFGPNGQGWPLGQRVLAAELMAVALQVDGIDYLTDLRTAQRGPTGAWGEQATIALQPWEVVELVDITVQVGSALAPGVDLPAPSTPTLVPIPIPLDQC